MRRQAAKLDQLIERMEKLTAQAMAVDSTTVRNTKLFLQASAELRRVHEAQGHLLEKLKLPEETVRFMAAVADAAIGSINDHGARQRFVAALRAKLDRRGGFPEK